MIPLNGLTLLISIALISFMLNTFQSLKNFYQQSHSLTTWDSTGLASATRIAKETNSMLLNFRDSLLESIASYDPNTGTTNQNYNNQRLTILKNYFANLDLNHPSILKSTIEFGLSPYNNLGYHKNYRSYQAILSHSNYLPTKFNSNDKSYASSLVTNSNSNIIALDNLEEQIIVNNNIKISSSLLNQLLENDQALLVENHPELFGLLIADDGLSVNNLPNAITMQVDILTN